MKQLEFEFVFQDEKWQDVPGFEGLYEVSDQGQVRSVGLMRKLSADKDGYLQVSLWKGNKGHTLKVHRLVAEVFLKKPANSTDVNHKDGQKANNRHSNLEWCTHKGNGEHAAKADLMAFGSGHGIAKLTEKDIPVIRCMLGEHVPMAKIAKQFSVSVSTIFDIAHGVTWVRA